MKENKKKWDNRDMRSKEEIEEAIKDINSSITNSGETVKEIYIIHINRTIERII